MKVLKSFYLYVAAVLLVIGLGIGLAPQVPNQQSRITHLETLVKCPSCDVLSVQQSNATSAVAVRHVIEKDVRSGMSDNQILTSLESSYGTNILLSPATSGIGVLLWLVPLLGIVALLVAGLRIWRRK